MSKKENSYLCVDLSELHVNIIVRCIKSKIKDVKLFTQDEDYIKELENIVWALGKGDEL